MTLIIKHMENDELADAIEAAQNGAARGITPAMEKMWHDHLAALLAIQLKRAELVTLNDGEAQGKDGR